LYKVERREREGGNAPKKNINDIYANLQEGYGYGEFI
jgi:hypothetical protein